MVNFQILQKGIYDFFQEVLPGERVIWAYANAPRPELPYISLEIKSNQTIGRDYISPVDCTGSITIFGNREFILEINFYGVGGLNKLEKIKTNFYSPLTNDFFYTYGLAFVNIINQTNVSNLFDTIWEERHLLELRFRHSNQDIEINEKVTTGWISKVGIHSTLEKSNDEKIENTFEVDRED